MSNPPSLFYDLGRPLGYGGYELLQIVAVTHLQSPKLRNLSIPLKILIRVALKLPSFFIIALWGTSAFKSSMGPSCPQHEVFAGGRRDGKKPSQMAVKYCQNMRIHRGRKGQRQHRKKIRGKIVQFLRFFKGL
jgi:hypothetical protein